MTDFFFTWQIALAAFLPKLLWAVVIFVVSLYLAKLASQVTTRLLKRRKPDPGAVGILSEMVRWGIIVMGTITALQQFTDVTTFLAGLGILGFTVGFALQDMMKNFAAGLLLLIQRPFIVGDNISVSGFDGTVIDINLRATELRTFDGLCVIIPNSDTLNHAVTNYTRSVNRRIQVVVSVDYDTDLNKARDAVIEAIQEVPGLLKEPAPMVVFDTFAEYSINLTAYYWVDTTQIGLFAARDAGVKFIKRAFDRHGINIPYPVRTMLTTEKTK
ncbi:MAG: mechanosensitive ion channel [Anaerolineales bacterium]